MKPMLVCQSAAFIEPSGNGGVANGESGTLSNMVKSDLEMIRVYEDLVDVLISKHVVVLTDFPQAAQEKLMRRKRLRSSFSTPCSWLGSFMRAPRIDHSIHKFTVRL